MAPLLSRLGLGVKPLQTVFADGVPRDAPLGVSGDTSLDVRVGAGLTPEELLADIRLVFADGRQLAGPDVYRYVFRRTWWGRPIYLFSITPGLRWIFDRAYRAVAARRHRISRMCRIAPVDPVDLASAPSPLGSSPSSSLMTESSVVAGAPVSVSGARTAWLALPGFLQAASAFSPAARLRVWGTIPFTQLHWLGGVVLVLGFGIAAAAILRRPRWMVAGGLFSLLIVAAMHIRLVRAPIGNFADHLMRHAIHPAWGFLPMYASIVLGFVAAAWLSALLARDTYNDVPIGR
jgi:hypothetical protein